LWSRSPRHRLDSGFTSGARPCVILNLRASLHPEFHGMRPSPTCPLFELGKTTCANSLKPRLATRHRLHGGVQSGSWPNSSPRYVSVARKCTRAVLGNRHHRQALTSAPKPAGSRHGHRLFLRRCIAAGLGLKDRAWQSLYHFTIGTPVDDPRLRTAPAVSASPRKARCI